MASRSAVMISGERSANWASSFLRSAGASWAAAALRCRTRPARSSSTAGSGIPATTALTAAASTGLTPRTSSRDVTALCSRHGTRAAAAMQRNTAAARAAESSASTTSTESAIAATSRMMAAWRRRSGHGAKKVDEEESSIAIAPAFFPQCVGTGRGTPQPRPQAASSGAGVAPLAHIDGLMSRLGFRARRHLAQALESRAKDNLAKRQQDYRYDERCNIIEHPEQQHPGKQVFPVHLPQADQHGGVEYPEPPGRMAGKAQQRRRDENDGDDDEAEIGLVRHQHIHRQRAEPEIDDADRDLQQRQRAARQRDGPGSAADAARLGPDPDHVPHQGHDDRKRRDAVEPGRQLIDRGGSFRMVGNAQAQHRGIAEPEGQPGEEADLGDVDRVQSPGRINPIAHRAAGEDTGADIVADRIGGEGGERVDAVGNVALADRANREPVVEGQREIACRHEQGRQPYLPRLGALDGLDHLIGVDATQHVIEHVASDPDDRDADHNPELMQDLLLAQKRDRPAYCFQHLDLELRSGDDAHGAKPAGTTLLPDPSGSAFWAGVEFAERQ